MTNTKGRPIWRGMALHMILGLALAGCMDRAKPVTPSPEPIDAQTSAVSTNPLSPQDAVRFAVLQSSQVGNARLSVQVSQNQVSIARAAFFPEIYFGLRPSLQANGMGSAELGVQYTIYDFGARAAQVQAAKSGVEMSQSKVITTTNQAIQDGVKDYIATAIALAKSSEAKAYMASIDTLQGRIQSRVDNGVASNIDLQDVEIAKSLVEVKILKAENDLRAAQIQLASRLGFAPQSVVPVAELQAILKPEFAKGSKIDLETLPDVQAHVQELAQAQATGRATKRGQIPTIGLKAGVSTDLLNAGGTPQDMATAGLNIGGTYGFGGARRRANDNAQLNADIAARNLVAARRNAALQINLASNEYASQLADLALKRKIADKTDALKAAIASDYEAGNRVLKDLIGAEDQLYAAKVDIWESEQDRLNAALRLMVETNTIGDRLYIPKSIAP